MPASERCFLTFSISCNVLCPIVSHHSHPYHALYRTRLLLSLNPHAMQSLVLDCSIRIFSLIISLPTIPIWFPMSASSANIVHVSVVCLNFNTERPCISAEPIRQRIHSSPQPKSEVKEENSQLEEVFQDVLRQTLPVTAQVETLFQRNFVN